MTARILALERPDMAGPWRLSTRPQEVAVLLAAPRERQTAFDTCVLLQQDAPLDPLLALL
jgi:hypothetical protein